jgi:FtsZ-binding cell division protein ZapB
MHIRSSGKPHANTRKEQTYFFCDFQIRRKQLVMMHQDHELVDDCETLAMENEYQEDTESEKVDDKNKELPNGSAPVRDEIHCGPYVFGGRMNSTGFKIEMFTFFKCELQYLLKNKQVVEVEGITSPADTSQPIVVKFVVGIETFLKEAKFPAYKQKGFVLLAFLPDFVHGTRSRALISLPETREFFVVSMEDIFFQSEPKGFGDFVEEIFAEFGEWCERVGKLDLPFTKLAPPRKNLVVQSPQLEPTRTSNRTRKNLVVHSPEPEPPRISNRKAAVLSKQLTSDMLSSPSKSPLPPTNKNKKLKFEEEAKTTVSKENSQLQQLHAEVNSMKKAIKTLTAEVGMVKKQNDSLRKEVNSLKSEHAAHSRASGKIKLEKQGNEASRRPAPHKGGEHVVLNQLLEEVKNLKQHIQPQAGIPLTYPAGFPTNVNQGFIGPWPHIVQQQQGAAHTNQDSSMSLVRMPDGTFQFVKLS